MLFLPLKSGNCSLRLSYTKAIIDTVQRCKGCPKNGLACRLNNFSFKQCNHLALELSHDIIIMPFFFDKCVREKIVQRTLVLDNCKPFQSKRHTVLELKR